jgi:hypothetical protein
MRTKTCSRTSILPSAIVIGVLAFTAGCGGDDVGIVSAPPQLKALLLSCRQESPAYTLTLLDSPGRPHGSAAHAIDEARQLVATALLQDGSTRAVVLTPAGCN